MRDPKMKIQRNHKQYAWLKIKNPTASIFFIVLGIIMICGAGLFGYWIFQDWNSNVSGEAGLSYASDQTKFHSEQTVLHPEPEPILLPKVTIDSVFSDHELHLSELDPKKLTRILATGDVLPARGVYQKINALHDYVYPFAKTAEFLSGADITVINLETPMITGCAVKTEGMVFCANPKAIEGLVSAGIDVVSLANNHIWNAGQKGIDETQAILEDTDMEWTGFGKLGIVKVHGTTFGFLGYNGVQEGGFNFAKIKSDIRNAKENVDVVILLPHWGKEYVSIPALGGSFAPDNPRDAARDMIASGADLIIGNHPHWVQGIEIIGETFVAYSHGNFLFDQTWSRETQEGAIGEYIFYEDKLISVKFYPVLVDHSYQPRILGAQEGAHILKRMEDASRTMAEGK